MQTMQSGVRGLTLLIELNADRLMFAIALGSALFLGSYLNSF